VGEVVGAQLSHFSEARPPQLVALTRSPRVHAHKHRSAAAVAAAPQVGLKGQPPLVEGKLPHRVKADDSYWTLDDDAWAATDAAGAIKGASSGKPVKTLSVFLTKADTMTWWERLAEGQPHIDITKVSARGEGVEGCAAAVVARRPRPSRPPPALFCC
jgi:hypothetical protein